MTCTGLLLAAGAGIRYGKPKALAFFDEQPFVNRAIDALRDGGCESVVVVLGAAADEVELLLPDDVVAVRAHHWRDGMGESLRSGMASIAGDAVLIHLVDLPDVDARVVARLRALASPEALCRASFHGTPGHPVVVGRTWWPEFVASLSGDEGARHFLRGRAAMIECGDLATGHDIDEPMPEGEQ